MIVGEDSSWKNGARVSDDVVGTDAAAETEAADETVLVLVVMDYHQYRESCSQQLVYFSCYC
jgi:hypothetical protein